MTGAVLEVQELHKVFPAGRRRVRAVDGVSFALEKGEILALVGESGCGKSTLAQMLVGLERPTSGQILFEGRDLAAVSERDLKPMRRRVQMVFQDPYDALNPAMSVAQIVAEPLLAHNLVPDSAGRRERVRQTLEEAGLKPAERFLSRHPHELSGGQRQRVAIAAALVLEPVLLLADEPVSMLDVSVRAEILNLLAELRERRTMSVLMVSHDLATAAAVADRMAVMYLGRFVELGPTQKLLERPLHPYTRALLDAVPLPDPRRRRQGPLLGGETPDPTDLPAGCRFHPRCPLATEACRRTDPLLSPAETDRQVACLRAGETP